MRTMINQQQSLMQAPIEHPHAKELVDEDKLSDIDEAEFDSWLDTI